MFLRLLYVPHWAYIQETEEAKYEEELIGTKQTAEVKINNVEVVIDDVRTRDQELTDTRP